MKRMQKYIGEARNDKNKAKWANMVRRVDRRTNALPDRQTDRQTDQQTNRPTDTASYRGALSHLKTR